MKLFLFLGLILIYSQQSVPLKPKEDFDIKLKYEFKQRTMDDPNAVHLSETSKDRERRTSTAMLPYVTLNIRMVKLTTDEVRLKIVDNLGHAAHNKKVKQDDVVALVMGFTDDMKDRVSAHQFTAYFLNGDREEQSRIVISVGKDGTFVVNDETRGKF